MKANCVAILGMSHRSRGRDFFVTAAILLLLSAVRSNAITFATLAEWQANPVNGNWNYAANWSPAVPNGPSDTAIFETSSITSVSITANTQVAAIVFDSGASAFTITASPALTLTISGAGITKNSAFDQKFVAAINGGGQFGIIAFKNSATAGSLTQFTNNGATASGAHSGETEFVDTSTAGSAIINNTGGAVGGAFGGITDFSNTSTAGSAIIVNGGGTVSGASGGETNFFSTSTAGSATINNDVGNVGSNNTGGGLTNFFNTSTAGSATITNNGSSFGTGGETDFLDTSTAGSATITNDGSGSNGGVTQFAATSTAGSASITNNGGTVSGTVRGFTQFVDTSTAGNSTFTNNGATVSGALGGFTVFYDTSTAGSATLIANGGTGGGGGGSISLSNDSTGGTARMEIFGNGYLDISAHNVPGVTTGSIEGNSRVYLGANNLTVGSNNRSTTFSGVIQDGDPFGGPETGGSLTKIGKGKLSVTTANTYTGGTVISKGTLLVKNKTGSATGTGAVQVNAGTLGGTGNIAGEVTIGNGTASGAILLGGNSATKPGTLTINNGLTFNSLSTYKCVLNRSTPKASQVSAFRVSINSNVPFTFLDTGSGTLAIGTVFTVINNTSNLPISGAFSNLPSGSIFTSKTTNFKVSYNGGTGNDMTLKVVP